MQKERDGFCIGDRVVLVIGHPDNQEALFEGDEGTSVTFEWNSRKYFAGVEWDKPLPGGHSCDRHCRPKHGWKVPREYIEHGCGRNELPDLPDAAMLFS